MTFHNVFTHIEKKVETTCRIIWEKIISYKLVHHTQSWCHVKPHLTLNKQLQKGQGMQGRKGKDRMMDIRKTFHGCGK